MESWILGKNGRYIYDSKANSQDDAVKYYGNRAKTIVNGFYYKSKQVEVTLLDKDVFMLNGLKNKVKNQATELLKMVATVKNTVNQLDEDDVGEAANDGTLGYMKKYVQLYKERHYLIRLWVFLTAYIQPLQVKIFSIAAGIISEFGVIAGGFANVASGVVSKVVKGIDNEINVWTVYQIAKEGYNKTK